MALLKEEVEKMYRRYYHDVYFFCRNLCGQNVDLAEDLTQNTFLKAIQSADSFRGDCQILTWLCRIAKNDFVSYMRKEKHLSKNEAAELLLENVPDTEASIHQRLEDRESAKEISRILDGLDEPYGEVFRLKIVYEKDYKDIAALYKKSESWARVTYYRAKQKIIEHMKQEGNL